MPALAAPNLLGQSTGYGGLHIGNATNDGAFNKQQAPHLKHISHLMRGGLYTEWLTKGVYRVILPAFTSSSQRPSTRYGG
ncbi:hypothetical protein, partial [Vibrio parahaemolyticus]|uniref:hypothetical protein n=1 Tax=Vibrio parahaemolyticus TaxID=670 RepID=UPI001C5F165C